MKPSPSTYASIGIGVPMATIAAWFLETCCSVAMPGEVQAAIGAVISALVGYFFTGGKDEDVAS
jgi:hypothetical protein